MELSEHTTTDRRTGRRVLGYTDLKARGITFSRVHIRRLEAAGRFPRHANLGAQRVVWFADEIDDFLDRVSRERDATVAA